MKQLRLVGKIEGISFLVLLFIAMPLKYWAGIPEAVKYTGWAHGALFMGYIALVIYRFMEDKWKFSLLVLALAAAVIPFGPFLIDKKLEAAERK
jgi:integral membrane protein